MSIYDYLGAAIFAFLFIYFAVTFFELNPKFNSKMIILTIIIYYLAGFITHIRMVDVPYIEEVSIFLLVYFCFKGSFLNNLIKFKLISLLYILLDIAVDLLLSSAYYFISGNSARLYVFDYSSELAFIATIISTTLTILFLNKLYSQYDEFIVALSGAKQKIVFIIAVIFPELAIIIIDTRVTEKPHLIIIPAVLLLLSLLTVFFIILLQRKQEIREIEARINYQNAQYKKLLTLQTHLKMFRHDINNLLEVNTPEIHNMVIEYCGEIKRDLEEL
ncbi:MAG: hypothetical protein GX078_09580 [Clostridiales bacterium]|nr:hypothetical protein [Clostridiales bacterium]